MTPGSTVHIFEFETSNQLWKMCRISPNLFIPFRADAQLEIYSQDLFVDVWLLLIPKIIRLCTDHNRQNKDFDFDFDFDFDLI